MKTPISPSKLQNIIGSPLLSPHLYVAPTSPAAAGPALPERVEQKFFITPSRASLALALLRRTCRPHPEFPAEQINSLYFDTSDLEQHERSLSGEFAKDKIRIRWYGSDYDPHQTALDRRAEDADRPPHTVGSPDATHPLVQIWLERKSRRGFAATKQRCSLWVEPALLVFPALRQGIVPQSLLTAAMAAFGFFADSPLQPIVVISYLRYRFVEPQSSFNIAYDQRIRSSMVAPGIGMGERALELCGAVVEIKGPRLALPPALHILGEIGCSWTRYSKYSASLEAHSEPLGSVSRLWPSGLLEETPGPLAPVPVPATSARPAPYGLAYESD